MTPQERIRANAELVVEQLRPISDVPDFGYNGASVAWLNDFVERQRVRPDVDEAGREKMCQTLGSYLGECVIASYGGAWQSQEGTWAVAFNDDNAVFPFNKIRKHFANGREDSIRGWFEMIPVVFAQRIKPQEQAQEAGGGSQDEWNTKSGSGRIVLPGAERGVRSNRPEVIPASNLFRRQEKEGG